MKLIDLHSHWGTKKGYVLRTEAALAKQRQTWNSDPKYHTESEMADYFRASGVKAILDFGFTKDLPLAEVRQYHDYALETQRSHSDAILGHWLQIDPRTGAEGAAELRRCIETSEGFVGIGISGSGTGIPASDPIYDPFYNVSVAAGRPVLVFVGTTGAGAGLPGGGGMVLDHGHPRHVDALAARRPELTIIAARPAWPWQEEMIAVMLHKPNVLCELHGWSPKYLTDSLKREVSRRLKNRVMFGADYPLFTYERLVADWRSLGYEEEVLQKVFHGNAATLLSKCMPGLQL
ncbi:MAG: amidohydrolase family protein [Betaproteobacteria bacterium]|nr:amidohydrolase family protein [Betaproteobacteria bacterium]